ncbi:dihydrofolate reductase family protein [Mucilaginibacter glaciei]|uniref:Dihydrofolate reductase n=1 Tax=Mucilaginibacter glaciei TaxID=2772109 RepID=A0A926NKE7_9SPHI|nr:dihydrofolate reductase family protein [Mucilaginibacter glaciei]MBD1393674.1 dihydrofolate reductase [Mucilaginibacter glaciei]
MRKIILNLAVSLDGFIEGPNGEYDWCFNDQDYGMGEFLESVDAIFIGRKSYDMVSADTSMFPVEKVYVFSDSLTDESHNANVELVTSAHFDEVVERVMNADGKNIWLFGGAQLVTALLNKGLVNTLILSIHPIILGAGKQLFKDIADRVELILTDQQSFPTGLLQVTYTLKPKFDMAMLDLL